VSEWEMLGECKVLASVLDIPPFSACVAEIGMMEMKGMQCNVLTFVLDIPPFSAGISMLHEPKA
jgi:hypothetical protein